MCSKKCAVPLFSEVSKRLPASIHTPTVAVVAKGVVSVATRSPLGSVVTCANKRRLCYIGEEPGVRASGKAKITRTGKTDNHTKTNPLFPDKIHYLTASAIARQCCVTDPHRLRRSFVKG
eukprot:270500-Prorocentrum_minimum.AAC.2